MNAGCYALSSRASAWKSAKPYFYAKWWPEGRGINETGRGFFNSPGEPVRLGKGGIELESLFLVTLTCPPYARGRWLSKTQNTQCTKCTKKTQNTQCTRCTKRGRWKIEAAGRLGTPGQCSARGVAQGFVARQNIIPLVGLLMLMKRRRFKGES